MHFAYITTGTSGEGQHSAAPSAPSTHCEKMRLLFTCFTLSAAVITPGADKLVDDALDGCDALLVKQLRTERDSAYKARDDAVEAKNAAEATAQRLAADEAA